MFVEPPATIAVLGGGPIGLETALYGRYLGYNVKLFERGQVADNVVRWGHVRMFSPFKMNASPLGLRALAAQDESYRPPEADALLTGKQWVDRYLLPLSKSDLVVDGICENTRVIAVSRQDHRKGELIGDPVRADSPFRLLVEDESGQRDEEADVVIDTTGTFGNHNWVGAGGAPSVGESQCGDLVEYGLPDILGDARSTYAGKHTLIVGSGYSAATNIAALATLISESASTQVTWVTSTTDDKPDSPIRRIPDDRLAARDELAQRANELVGDAVIRHLGGARIEEIAHDSTSGQLAVRIYNGETSSEESFDNIIANVGYRPDATLYAELQVHQCYATDGPMNLAAELLGEESGDCLDQSNHGAATLLTPEPNFYILGSKSYGRNSNFLVSLGLEQVRDVFSIIGDREDLDLYATMQTST